MSELEMAYTRVRFRGKDKKLLSVPGCADDGELSFERLCIQVKQLIDVAILQGMKPLRRSSQEWRDIMQTEFSSSVFYS